MVCEECGHENSHGDDCSDFDGAPTYQWEVTEPAEVYGYSDFYDALEGAKR